MIDGFVRDIESRKVAVAEFNDKLWVAVIDRVVVGRDGTIVFRFRNGSVVRRRLGCDAYCAAAYDGL